eukprot:XP_008660822.1 uncharacterized protein LOC103639922 [Zea mays]
MVNTRKGGGSYLPANHHNRRIVRQPQPEMNPLNPPPVGTDPVVAAQMQMLRQMANTMTKMQAQMRQERQEMRQECQEMRQEMSSLDPLHADDWLKSVEKMFNIAQCNDREKVLYASGCLTGLTSDWWDSYIAAHVAADTITWAEFATQFRNYHIPAGLMKIKKKEFLSLKQGNMSVSEYRDKFIHLSRYTPDEVANDERKQEHFMEGLIGPL